MTQRKPDLRQATAADGTRITFAHYTTPGAPEQRVALLHSLAMDHTFWDGVVDALDKSTEIIAIDARGHGRSDKPNGPYTTELFADDLNAVFDEARWQDAIVAGASMGGCVTLAFAGKYPGRVKGLGLIDTTAWYGEDAIVPWEERGQKAIAGGMEALIGFQKKRWFSDAFIEANPSLVEESLAVFLKNDSAPYLETCRMLGTCDSRSALADFSFPVAILVGEEDYATPVAMAQSMNDAIADSTLQVIDGARHYTPIEVPGTIAAALHDVMCRL